MFHHESVQIAASVEAGAFPGAQEAKLSSPTATLLILYMEYMYTFTSLQKGKKNPTMGRARAQK